MKLGDRALELISGLELGDYLGDILVGLLTSSLSTATIQNGVTLAASHARVDRIQDNLDPTVQVLVLDLVILNDLVRFEDRVLLDLNHLVD